MGRLASLISCFALLAAAPADVHLTPLGAGASAALSEIGGRAHVVMFWRSDCAPCLIELHELADLQRAAGEGSLLTVALEPREQAAATFAQLGLSTRNAFVADEDAQTALERVSRGGRRLPYAVALDADGRVCARHVGLLGTLRAHAWATRCSR